jgi:transposase
MNTYYNEFFEKEQQKIHFDLYQIGLPSDDPVYTLNKVLEELDYTSLVARYNTKGRKGYNPIMMFAVLTYANMRGVKAIDRIVELGSLTLE